MNAADVTGFVVAGIAVITSAGSVILLAVRVGQLAGSSEARLKAGEDDRTGLWTALGVLTGRFDRHIEQHNRRKR